MRRIELPGSNLQTSCVGFGCASLGSRVSARAGLDALVRAYDAGVTWFDLAPAYGAGEAETIFAEFLRPRREAVQVLTKVGLAPPARSGLLRAAYTVLRPVAGLKRRLKPGAIARNRTVEITPASIETSIAASLRRLGTDRVDVLALHDPDTASVGRDDVARALERVLARGQARAVGVAGSSEACLAGTAPGLPYRVFQTAAGTGRTLAVIRDAANRPVTTIGHSVMRGSTDAADRSRRLRDALAANADGVTLLSMFGAAHLVENLVIETAFAGELAASPHMHRTVEAAL